MVLIIALLVCCFCGVMRLRVVVVFCLALCLVVWQVVGICWFGIVLVYLIVVCLLAV